MASTQTDEPTEQRIAAAERTSTTDAKASFDYFADWRPNVNRALRSIRALRANDACAPILFDATVLPGHHGDQSGSYRLFAVRHRLLGDYSLRLESHDGREWGTYNEEKGRHGYNPFDNGVSAENLRLFVEFFAEEARGMAESVVDDYVDDRGDVPWMHATTSPVYVGGSAFDHNGHAFVAFRVMRHELGEGRERVWIEAATNVEPVFRPDALGTEISDETIGALDVVVSPAKANRVADYYSELIKAEAKHLREENVAEAEREGVTEDMLLGQWMANQAAHEARIERDRAGAAREDGYREARAKVVAQFPGIAPERLEHVLRVDLDVATEGPAPIPLAKAFLHALVNATRMTREGLDFFDPADHERRAA